MILREQYNPLPAQERFHQTPGLVRLAAGGVRSGKTTAGAREFLALCSENPGCDVCIVAPFHSVLHAVTLREFLKVCPPEWIRYQSKQHGYLQLVNGTRVYYRSAENPTSYEGLTLAAFWGDECRYWTREAWTVLLSRLSCPKAGRLAGILTSTPVMGWMYEEFGQPSPDRQLIHFPTTDNYHLHSGYMDNLRRSLSKGRYKQYLLGLFVPASGAVYPEFDENLHVRPLQAANYMEVDCGFDPGIRRAGVVFGQRFQYCDVHQCRDCVHFLDDLVLEDMPAYAAAEQINAIYRARGWAKGTMVMDPAGNARGLEYGMTVKGVLEDKGWKEKIWTNLSPMSRNIANGIEVTRRKLRNLADETSLYCNSTHMLGTENGLIRAFQLSEYEQTKQGKKLSDKPVRDGKIDHIRDAGRYLLMYYCPPVPSQAFIV